MFQRQFETLIAFASGERFREDLLKAKAHYFSQTGEVFEDDKSFEMRMSSFLDFYVCDWPLDSGRTPAQIFLTEDGAALPSEDQSILRGLTETRHSLWEVRKLGNEFVRLRDCFTGEDVDVFERRKPIGLNKGDLLEARLVPVDGKLVFSSSFCFHPAEVRKQVMKEIRRLKKEQPDFDPRAFVWALARKRLKYERYRNIAVTDIYAFDRKTI